MKTLLLHPERAWDREAPLPATADDLVRDLALDPLFDAMARADPFVRDVARRAVLHSEVDPSVITWRLDAVEDARAHTAVVRQLYELSAEALARERSYWGFGQSPSSVLYRGVHILEGFADALEGLRGFAEGPGPQFRSPAFRRFFAMVREELDAAYLAEVRSHLHRLRFDDGTVLSARLGAGNLGTGYVLRLPADERPGWWRRHWPARASPFSFEIAERDEVGARALTELRDQGYASVARAVARSNDHLHGFFSGLRSELAFYLAAAHLAEDLSARGLSVGRPEPLPAGSPEWEAEGLYLPGLALLAPGPIVVNRLAATGKGLVVVTGPNQGGKSTFLRSVGTAQLLLQAGLPVPGARYRSAVAPAIATHFARAEDPTFTSGRLDDELRRMSTVVSGLRPGALLLSNESFSSTNEREGSEIADQVFRAALDAGVRVVVVTHFHELASALATEVGGRAQFLLAERTADGRRTFRLIEGAPRPTSFAADVYRTVFGTSLPAAPDR
ncbi:MAG TPA: DNA mismatch repair protein MutS [Thermoplasmata archaeon]|nr:DNA mismatch repair protein MutS [Thermoplasmata archaeon]